MFVVINRLILIDATSYNRGKVFSEPETSGANLSRAAIFRPTILSQKLLANYPSGQALRRIYDLCVRP